MTLKYYSGNRITGTASERGSLSTTNLIPYTNFHETDTDDVYTWDGDSWNIVASNTGTETLVNKTLTSPVLTTPKIGTSLNDANGNELIVATATSSAVNEITLANAATGNAPSIVASGGDTNVSLKISGKGTGGVKLTNATANGAFLEFDTKATPADPSTEQARMYLKNSDANNNVIAVKIQKSGVIQEVEITSPKAVCAVCGGTAGAKDPTYDFARSVMILDLWCGHSFEVPMQWSQINGNS